jgi:hypothetical protein
VTIAFPFGNLGSYTGPLNDDGSFSAANHAGSVTIRGVFATEGGRTVIRDALDDSFCREHFTATKQ